MVRSAILAASLLVAAALPQTAAAWGNTGHRLVGRLAAEALPAEMPEFLRTSEAAAELGELSREPDRSRGAGKIHDGMRDPAHFVDVDDAGKILGGPELTSLPPTFLEYETALRAAGTDSSKAGYLPYALVDGWQQLVKDFALWRVGVHGEATEKDPARLAWLKADRLARERLIIRDLGTWSHYVGDATYPPHLSIHYNGWGDHPNPKGFTTEKIHVPLEGPFLAANVTADAVRAKIKPLQDCNCRIEERVKRYLVVNSALLEPFYQLEKDGGFKPRDPRGPDFLAGQLGAAVSELRDLVVDAWQMSETMSVGYPAITLADIKAGKMSAYDVLYSTGD
jgi:hypothetical protein